MKNWFPADDEQELKSLQRLVCSGEFGGMDDFRKERSHILRMAYHCMDNNKWSFGACQKKSWARYKDAVKDCIQEEI